MTASFAAYASQFLNRQPPQASVSSSQPLFFSFTTDGGGRAASELDDLDDPHLRGAGSSTRHDRRGEGGRGRTSQPMHDEYEDEDEDGPYLRLDEDTSPAGVRAPLIGRSQRGAGADSDAGAGGWLAHHISPLRAPSPDYDEEEDDEEEDGLLAGVEEDDRFGGANRATTLHSDPEAQHPSPSLTASLLPGRAPGTFHLPDPRHLPPGRRRYNDAPWLAAYLSALSACLLGAFLLLILAHITRPPPGSTPASKFPYSTLLRTVPLVCVSALAAAALTYAHVLALRYAVRPVLAATEVFVPGALAVCAIWAFAGSFGGDGEETWGETVGLRLFALVPLGLAILTAHRLLRGLPRRLNAAASTLKIVSEVLFGDSLSIGDVAKVARGEFTVGGEPFLLALSPALLLAALLASIPFATVVFRLLLVGYFRKVDSGSSGESASYVWNVRTWARWALAFAVAAWLWTWAVARGILRVVAAGVVGGWYFGETPRPRPSTHTIHAALFRATHTSLGTVCLAGALLSALRFLAVVTAVLSRLPAWLTLGAMSTHPIANVLKPVALMAASGIAWAVRYLETVGEGVGADALVYAGLTGEAFWKAAGRSAALVDAARDSTDAPEATPADAGVGRHGLPTGATHRGAPAGVRRDRMFGWARRTRRGGFGDAPLSLLTLAPLTLCLPFALGAYLFTAHTLGAPNEALGAAVLVGSVAGLVGRFCVGVVVDCADTLYLCYCMDKDAGQRRRPEVFALFESLEREPVLEPPVRARREEAQLVLGGAHPDERSSTRQASSKGKSKGKGKYRHQQSGILQEPQLFGGRQEEQLFGGQSSREDARTHRSRPSHGSTARTPLPLEGSEYPMVRSAGPTGSRSPPSVDDDDDEDMEPAEGYDASGYGIRSTGRHDVKPAEADDDIDPFHHSFHEEMAGSIAESERPSGSGLITSGREPVMTTSSRTRKDSMSDASIDDEAGESQFFPGSGLFG
ncbi:hypothetical protein BD626DRAFT_508658 [Schizophyllum amplum]|uniref:Plasma-membrane choline transporter-domain-containing protein n=1 Tax=Schizophyllum amplum TaxID=97359 RepID=A0A550C353_9AGAR|nr:hypothetical protein BD626DRAFT_508658 [Auriculariopsis ampla]